MIWQDIVIALIVVVFTCTTLPMIRDKIVLPILTTLPMFAGAVILTGTYGTLRLWYSMAVELVAAGLWLILLWRSATLQAVGRYDGEDYSAEYYAQRAAEEASAREGNMASLVRYLAPKNWKYIARLRPLGYANYGEFGEEEALKALGRVGNKRHLLKAWEKAGLIWPRSRPIFRKDLDSCIQLSPSGEQLAEMYGGKSYPTYD